MKINFWGLEVGSEAIDEVKPKGMTTIMFITYIINILTMFFFLFTFAPIEFDKSLISLLDNIWGQNQLITFITLMLFGTIIVRGIRKVKRFIEDRDLDIAPEFQLYEMNFLASCVSKLFVLYASSYLLVLVLKRNAEVSTIKGELLPMGIFIFCLIVSIVSFIKLSGIVFRCDNSFEEYTKKSDYMKRTLKKFEKETSENIEKRIQLLRLYEETQKLYQQGIRLDQSEFNRQRRDEISKKIRNL